MGLVDIWAEIMEFQIDIFTYTEAERNHKKYKKIIKKIDKIIEDCYEMLEEYKGYAEKRYEQLDVDSEEYLGEIDNMLKRKAPIVEQNRASIVKKIELALIEAEDRRTEAVTQRDLWEAKVEAEEKEIRDYYKSLVSKED